MDSLLPIPKENLTLRFQPIFSSLNKSRHSTVLALPYTGRTSHLRYLSAHPEFISLPTNHKIISSETGSQNTSSAFYSEILLSLNSNLLTHPAVLSKDNFLLIKEISNQLSNLSYVPIIVLTFHASHISLFTEVEEQFILLTRKHPTIKILWSLDTSIIKNASHRHPSSPLFENLNYFPTFSPKETLHSLKRIASSRKIKLSSKLINNAVENTGGIAGLFHNYLFLNSDYRTNSHTHDIVNTITNELISSPELSNKLTTPQCREFLNSFRQSQYYFSNIKLLKPLSAQEILILKALNENINLPVTREQIADILWGKLSAQKYSDWAIDKAMSRLRQNLNSNNHRLITIKNHGYSLICQRN